MKRLSVVIRAWLSPCIIGLLALGSMLIVGCGGSEKVETGKEIGTTQSALTTSFGNMTQSQRNQLILNKALSYSGQYHPGDNNFTCKNFARKVVNEASNWDATLPSNDLPPNDWRWASPLGDAAIHWSPYQYPIETAEPGNIVQMITPYATGGSGPHTAIVYSIGVPLTGFICFIDSNYVSPGYTVAIHCDDLGHFVATTPQHVVYEIRGH